MSEQGDKARKALHDMRWGPHIDDPIERQEIMDNAIKVALGTVAALEADNKENDRLLLAAAMKYTALEAILTRMEREAQNIADELREHVDAEMPEASLGWCMERIEALAGESDDEQ